MAGTKLCVFYGRRFSFGQVTTAVHEIAHTLAATDTKKRHNSNNTNITATTTTTTTTNTTTTTTTTTTTSTTTNKHTNLCY